MDNRPKVCIDRILPRGLMRLQPIKPMRDGGRRAIAPIRKNWVMGSITIREKDGEKIKGIGMRRRQAGGKQRIYKTKRSQGDRPAVYGASKIAMRGSRSCPDKERAIVLLNIDGKLGMSAAAESAAAE